METNISKRRLLNVPDLGIYRSGGLKMQLVSRYCLPFPSLARIDAEPDQNDEYLKSHIWRRAQKSNSRMAARAAYSGILQYSLHMHHHACSLHLDMRAFKRPRAQASTKSHAQVVGSQRVGYRPGAKEGGVGGFGLAGPRAGMLRLSSSILAFSPGPNHASFTLIAGLPSVDAVETSSPTHGNA
jgi:hypothetical protein